MNKKNVFSKFKFQKTTIASLKSLHFVKGGQEPIPLTFGITCEDTKYPTVDEITCQDEMCRPTTRTGNQTDFCSPDLKTRDCMLLSENLC